MWTILHFSLSQSNKLEARWSCFLVFDLQFIFLKGCRLLPRAKFAQLPSVTIARQCVPCTKPKAEAKHEMPTTWVDLRNMRLSERSPAPKATHLGTHWWKCPEQANLQRQGQTAGCQGLGAGVPTDGHRASFWSEENVLELDRGGGGKTLWLY